MNKKQLALALKRTRASRIKYPLKHILYRVRNNSRVMGIKCSLTIDDIPPIPEYCPVFTWIKIKYRVGHRKTDKDRWNSPSLDRIDNNKGYIKGNVRIVSFRANCLKRDATDQELAALGKDAEKRITQ